MNDTISVRSFAGIRSRCVLHHADCNDVLPIKADAVVTDPPYGIGKTGFQNHHTAGQRNRNMDAFGWDNETADVSGLLSLAPIVVIWGGNYYQLPASRGWLVWHKPDAVPSMSNAELAWTNQDRNTRLISWSIAATNSERTGHPTQKPVRVMAWTLEEMNVPMGATVIDPYMGSGSTGVACIRLGINFIGIEKDPHYFQTAHDRIQREISQGVLF